MSICPVCRMCLGREKLLITHIDKEHHSFQPFKQLRAQIIFPFNCTMCNEHIADLKDYLIHMHCDHPDLFKQLVDNFYLFEEQNSLIDIPRNWLYLPMRNEAIEIPFEGEIMIGSHRKNMFEYKFLFGCKFSSATKQTMSQIESFHSPNL